MSFADGCRSYYVKKHGSKENNNCKVSRIVQNLTETKLLFEGFAWVKATNVVLFILFLDGYRGSPHILISHF